MHSSKYLVAALFLCGFGSASQAANPPTALMSGTLLDAQTTEGVCRVSSFPKQALGQCLVACCCLSQRRRPFPGWLRYFPAQERLS
jgi:hypothetical protein